MQSKDIFFQVKLPLCYIRFTSLATTKHSPSQKQICYTGYIIKYIAMNVPPPATPTLIMHMSLVYREVYLLGKKIPKADKLGIHTTLQNQVLLAFESTISAAFAHLETKLTYLEDTRTAIEVSKHLLRTEQELAIIPETTYIRIAKLLVDASKMTTSWLKNTEARIGTTKNSLF